MMKVIEQAIEGVFISENFLAEDQRGSFIKTFNNDVLQGAGFTDPIKESYFSLSHKNVLRGMHYQQPPYDHEKLIYVTSGKILDVILDLREKSMTYGKFLTIELHQYSHSIFIPKGCAHGFLTLSETATVIYNVTTVHNKEADKGILWNSFGFDWPVQDPILSERDLGFSGFSTYSSPFL